MWTIRFPSEKDHPDAAWGWNFEEDRPHFFDVTVLRPKNPDKRSGVAIPVMLDRSQDPLRIELGRVLKDRSGITLNWWCFGFYRKHLRQPSPDSLVTGKLPLEPRLEAWKAFQDDFMEHGAGFVTRRAAITHMLYRTGWYDRPF